MSAPTIEEQIEAVTRARDALDAFVGEGFSGIEFDASLYEVEVPPRVSRTIEIEDLDFLEALGTAQDALKRMPPESLARIGLMVLEQWSEGYSDIETIDVQELAVKAGALVETVFDPEQHNDEHGAAGAGDPWFLFSDEVKKYRAIPTQDAET